VSVSRPVSRSRVGAEQREHLLLADAATGLGDGVHVGDERDRGVAHAQLAGERRFGLPLMLIMVQPWPA
jgi:hypothetical protein